MPHYAFIRHLVSGFDNDRLDAEPCDDLNRLVFGNFVFKFISRQRAGFTFERDVSLVPENADAGAEKRCAAEVTLLDAGRSLRTLSPGVIANEEFSFDFYSHGSSNLSNAHKLAAI